MDSLKQFWGWLVPMAGSVPEPKDDVNDAVAAKRRALMGVIYTPIWCSILSEWLRIGAPAETLLYVIGGCVLLCWGTGQLVRKPLAEYVAAEIVAYRQRHDAP